MEIEACGNLNICYGLGAIASDQALLTRGVSSKEVLRGSGQEEGGEEE